MAVGPDRPSFDPDYEAWELKQRYLEATTCVDCEKRVEVGDLDDDGRCESCVLERGIRKAETMLDSARGR